MQEKIIEIKSCKQCNISFFITDKDIEFYDKISPKFNWEKYQIPTPTLCPECRQIRRFAIRNERKLYKRKCDVTWKDIISIYSPDKPYKVYEQSEWWSDKWDPLDYWRDFDFSRNFFNQFEELLRDVPKLSMTSIENLNSDYLNISANCKNCYLSFAIKDCENTLYSYWITNSTNCLDCNGVENSTNCYELVDCSNCYDVTYSQKCIDCSESTYLYDCTWCDKCFLCAWIRSKKYCILNIQFKKEDYYNEVAKLNIDETYFDLFLDKYNNLLKKTPRKNLDIINSEDSIWDNIKYSTNCENSFHIVNWNNIKYSTFCKVGAEDCLDNDYFGVNTKFSYESVSAWIESKKCLFDNIVWTCNEIYYSDNCFSTSNIFWSAWLNHKKYCILNKQYEKSEYEKLVPKIIEHMQKTWEWWEFFPAKISQFWYNETVAQEYFPLSKEEALKKWFKWSDYDQLFPKVEKIITANKLPKNIVDIPNDILNWAIECEITKKPFKITSQELDFYRKHNLPIPKKHPDLRHLDRMKLRNPRKLYDRKCDKCGVDIKTTYNPLRPEIVYCEECYNK